AELTLADRFYPSTRRCARCGVVGEALSLSERIFRCSSCGHEADRDTNAAACLAQYPRIVDASASASGTGPHVAVKQAETQNVCGEDSAGTRSVWSVRETVLYEAERTSVQRPRRAVLYETVNTLLRPFAQRATPTLQRQGAPAAMARRRGCCGQAPRLLWPGAAAAVARRPLE